MSTVTKRGRRLTKVVDRYDMKIVTEEETCKEL